MVFVRVAFAVAGTILLIPKRSVIAKDSYTLGLLSVVLYKLKVLAASHLVHQDTARTAPPI